MKRMSNLKKPVRRYLRYRKVAEWTLKELGLLNETFDIILLDTPEFVDLYKVFILLQSEEAKRRDQAGNIAEYGLPHLPRIPFMDAIMLAKGETSLTDLNEVISFLKKYGGNAFTPKLPPKSLETIIQFYEMMKSLAFIIAVNKPIMNLPDYNEAKKKIVIIHEVLDYRDSLKGCHVSYEEQDRKAEELYEKYKGEIL